MIPITLPEDTTSDQKAVTDAAHKLPPLSVVASQIIDQLGNEFISLPDLVAIIEQDPATSGRLLSLANSAMYRCPNPILSLHDAVIKVLGLDITRAISLGIAFSSLLNRNGSTSKNQHKIWLDSMLMANCTRELARQSPAQADNAALAYTGALLSNLGLLALASHYPQRVDACFEQVESYSDDESQVQETLDTLLTNEFGFDHRLIAVELAHVWKLPQQLLPLIALNPRTTEAPFQELAELAVQIRKVIDNQSRGLDPLPTWSISELPAELHEGITAVCKRLDKLTNESENAARAITSAG